MATVSVIVPGRATVQTPIVGRADASVQSQGRTAISVIVPGRSPVQAPIVSQTEVIAQAQTLASTSESASPALPFNSLQFNNGGFLGGSSSLLFNSPSSLLVLSGSAASFVIHSTELPNENLFLIKKGVTNLLKVDSLNHKLTFNGTGYFNALYIGNEEVATKTYVAAVSGYLDDKTDFIFASASAQTGITSQFISFGQNLSYTPRVIADLINPQNQDLTYFLSIDSINTSGFTASYSSSISHSGYILEYFASSQHFSV